MLFLYQINRRYFLIDQIIFLCVISVLGGCSLGPLEVSERYYLAATNGRETAYFRVRVNAETFLSKSEFRQGWFPARAVDALFGDVSDEGGGKALTVREKLRAQIDDAVLKTTTQYLEAAVDPNTPADRILKLLETRNRVLLTPSPSLGPSRQAQLIEYDPKRGLTTLRSDEKLVFVLSANPDEVIGNIANFAEQERTEQTIQKFTEVLVQNSRKEVATKEATAEVEGSADKLVAGQIEIALKTLQAGVTRDEAMQQVGALIHLLQSLR
jgi:hypothetical protein